MAKRLRFSLWLQQTASCQRMGENHCPNFPVCTSHHFHPFPLLNPSHYEIFGVDSCDNYGPNKNWRGIWKKICNVSFVLFARYNGRVFSWRKCQSPQVSLGKILPCPRLTGPVNKSSAAACLPACLSDCLPVCLNDCLPVCLLPAA